MLSSARKPSRFTFRNEFYFFFCYSVDVCQSYLNLTSSSRKTTNKVADNKLCDKSDIPQNGQWYRFQGDAGTRMATTCPDKERCGAHFPGWLDGDPPTVKNVEKQMWAYFNNRNCYNDHRRIRVKNCGAYTIYHLVPAQSCAHRYCGTD